MSRRQDTRRQSRVTGEGLNLSSVPSSQNEEVTGNRMVRTSLLKSLSPRHLRTSDHSWYDDTSICEVYIDFPLFLLLLNMSCRGQTPPHVTSKSVNDPRANVNWVRHAVFMYIKSSSNILMPIQKSLSR